MHTFRRDSHPSTYLATPIPAQPATQASQSSNHLLVVVEFDDGVLPFASLDLSLEQNVDLTEGSVLHLRNELPRHDGAEKGGASPDIATLAADVPLIRVEHVAGKEDARNVDHVVGTSPNTCCQWPETNGRCLADNDPGGRGGSQAEQNGDDQAE